MFLYTDAWDTYFVSDMAEMLNKMPDYKMFIGSEKVCFPNPQLTEKFPSSPYAWRFINGGGFITDTEFFIYLYENFPPTSPYNNDQEWLSNMFLLHQNEIKIDYLCEVFQPLAFSNDVELVYKNDIARLYNTTTETYPVILHGNAQTPMENAYKLHF